MCILSCTIQWCYPKYCLSSCHKNKILKNLFLLNKIDYFDNNRHTQIRWKWQDDRQYFGYYHWIVHLVKFLALAEQLCVRIPLIKLCPLLFLTTKITKTLWTGNICQIAEQWVIFTTRKHNKNQTLRTQCGTILLTYFQRQLKNNKLIGTYSG